jgi:hypothetical protein
VQNSGVIPQQNININTRFNANNDIRHRLTEIPVEAHLAGIMLYVSIRRFVALIWQT